MKVIPFQDICKTDVALSDVSVIYQTPVWDRLGAKNAQKSGVRNGFLLIHKGGCRYEWDDVTVDLQPGSLIYLPSGCHRVVTVTERPFSFYRLSFTMTDLSEGAPVIFSKTPVVFTDKASKNLFSQAEALVPSTLSQNNKLGSCGLMFDFLHTLSRQLTPQHGGRITAALDYIESRYTEPMDVARLAELCALSESQFYDAFKKKTGMSPIRYRNHLRVRQAKILLESGEITNQEIGQMLGFETIHYFSRVFKEHAGISPSQYIPK